MCACVDPCPDGQSLTGAATRGCGVPGRTWIWFVSFGKRRNADRPLLGLRRQVQESRCYKLGVPGTATRQTFALEHVSQRSVAHMVTGVTHYVDHEGRRRPSQPVALYSWENSPRGCYLIVFPEGLCSCYISWEGGFQELQGPGRQIPFRNARELNVQIPEVALNNSPHPARANPGSCCSSPATGSTPHLC